MLVWHGRGHGASSPVPIRRTRASDEHGGSSPVRVRRMSASDGYLGLLPVPVGRMRASQASLPCRWALGAYSPNDTEDKTHVSVLNPLVGEESGGGK